MNPRRPKDGMAPLVGGSSQSRFQNKSEATFAAPHVRAASLTKGLLAFSASLTLFSACTPYGKVTEQRAHYAVPTHSEAALAETQKAIASAATHQRRDPRTALAEYVSALQSASQRLTANPSDIEVRNAYNFALSRIFSTIRSAKLDPWSQPLSLPTGFVLTHVPDPRPQRNPGLYELIPADELKVSGAYIEARHQKEGLGAPLVSLLKPERANLVDVFFTPPKVCFSLTAVARFEGRRCIISFEDPLGKEEVSLGGRRFPLAADYTASLAMMLARERFEWLEIARLFFPGKYAASTRVARLQPFDPDKTPVLIVHGLMGSSATWVPMLNELRADPIIRRNFQFWYYTYPSGYPIPYSASLLRDQLDAIEKAFPCKKKMIIIGHSMGGVISRLMVSDSGDKVWRATFGEGPDETLLPRQTAAYLREALIFHHRPEIGRAIFIAAPHRGSDLATSWAARLVATLVRAPAKLVHLTEELRQALTLQIGALQLNRAPTSLDNLSPRNSFVKSASALPIVRGLPYHSIMGDRGRGDGTKSSDGFVSYWSSHLDGATSERIVPSGHSAHQSPQGIEEVRRILYSHLKK